MAHEVPSMWKSSVLFLLIQIVQCFPRSRFGTAALGAPISECATRPDYEQWFQPSQVFDIGDCSRAIDIFYHDYVKDHNNIPYEFLTSGVNPVHGIPTQRLPLKVASGGRIPAVSTQHFRSVIDPSQVPVWLRLLCETNSDGAIYQARNHFDRLGRT